MKKILIGIILFFVLLVIGTNIFVQTKSDFIIEKVSELLEQNLNAQLKMQELPKISIFPNLSVKAGKASLTSKDYTITFDQASVNISLFKLISGTVQINSVSLDTLNLQYTAPKTTPQHNTKTNKEQNQQTSKNEQTQSIEEIIALIPTDIFIRNSNIFYKDQDQEIQIKNLNAKFEDFGINKNSSTILEGEINYTNKTNAIVFKILSDIDFLLMGSSIEYSINSFNFTPIKGLPITKPIDITAQSAMSFNPIIIENIDGKIKSPFVDLKITGTGNKKEGNITLTGDVYPLATQEFLMPDTIFQNIPKTAQINSALTVAKDKITLKNFELKAHNAIITIQGLYDILKQDLTASLTADHINIHDYLVKETKQTAQTTNKNKKENIPQKTQNTSQKISNPFKLTFNITANANNIAYNDLIIDTIHSKLTGDINNKKQIIHVTPLTITSNKESINATAKIELNPNDLISINYDIPKLTARHWIKAISKQAGLDATINSKGTINFKTSNPIATLNGNGQLNGNTIKIYTKLLPFIANILKASPKIEDSYEFTTLSAPYTIKNGVVSLSNTYVDSPVIYVNTNGIANLNTEYLNLHGNVELRKQYLVFPYTVKGSFNDPSVGIDLGKQLQIIGGGLLHGGQAIGGGLIDGGKTVGGGVVEGGKVLGGGLVKGGKALEKGLNKLFK